VAIADLAREPCAHMGDDRRDGTRAACTGFLDTLENCRQVADGDPFGE
jgi:hypothetical protein